MDAHHDVPIALLQPNWECAGLVCVDGVQQLIHHNEDVVVLVDGQRWWVCCARFYLDQTGAATFVNCTPFCCPFVSIPCKAVLSITLGRDDNHRQIINYESIIL